MNEDVKVEKISEEELKVCGYKGSTFLHFNKN